MLKDYENMELTDMLGTLVTFVPLHQINFLKLQDFVGEDGISRISAMREHASVLNMERCHFCSYPKTPFNHLVVKGEEIDEPPNIVGDFHYISEVNVVQMRGVRFLCDTCYEVHLAVVNSASKGTKLSVSREYKTMLLPLANKMGVAVTDFAGACEKVVSKHMELKGKPLLWDLTYLYHRNMVDERSMQYSPTEKDISEAKSSTPQAPVLTEDELRKQQQARDIENARVQGGRKTASSGTSPKKSVLGGPIPNVREVVNSPDDDEDVTGSFDEQEHDQDNVDEYDNYSEGDVDIPVGESAVETRFADGAWDDDLEDGGQGDDGASFDHSDGAQGVEDDSSEDIISGADGVEILVDDDDDVDLDDDEAIDMIQSAVQKDAQESGDNASGVDVDIESSSDDEPGPDAKGVKDKNDAFAEATNDADKMMLAALMAAGEAGQDEGGEEREMRAAADGKLVAPDDSRDNLRGDDVSSFDDDDDFLDEDDDFPEKGAEDIAGLGGEKSRVGTKTDNINHKTKSNSHLPQAGDNVDFTGIGPMNPKSDRDKSDGDKKGVMRRGG